ncbi:MAG: sodium-dependent transporter [Bacteroidaceae bacterium]|nr:sodium-dependent transporter [Bacteroidaceae bacterium]
MESRGRFSSRIGVILASAGSAVGLGNIWRFPTEVGQNGGAAFILVYVGFVFFLALPVMLSEFVIGRSSKSNTVDAYRMLSPGTPWVITGFMGVLAGFLVLSFYSVVAGWTMHYAVSSLLCRLSAGHDFGAEFNAFISHPLLPLGYLAAFLLLSHLVVERGVQSGIERYSKWMMPLLFIIIFVLVACSLSMPGVADGLRFLLRPDFSKVTWPVVLSAIGQAFFSLSVGIGCMITYASYFGPRMRLVPSAIHVCIIDTLVAVTSGFIIFPAVFSVPGLSVDAGPGLVFITLPNVFNAAFSQIPPVGYVFSLLFYVLLLLAALTSSISMHEICTAFIHEKYGLSRRRAAWVVTLLCFVGGAACALSFGPLRGLTIHGMGIFALFDYLTAKFFMPLGGILITLFVGWKMPRMRVMDELTNGGTCSRLLAQLFFFLIRWVAPLGVCIIFVNGLR